MPPNQMRSTGAFRIAEISASGSIVPCSMPSFACIALDSLMLLASRAKTPPPLEISALS